MNNLEEQKEEDNKTIVNMNVEGMPWFNKNEKKHQEHFNQLSKMEKITFKERLAMIRGAYAVILPIVLGMAAVFFVGYFLLYLYLTR